MKKEIEIPINVSVSFAETFFPGFASILTILAKGNNLNNYVEKSEEKSYEDAKKAYNEYCAERTQKNAAEFVKCANAFAAIKDCTSEKVWANIAIDPILIEEINNELASASNIVPEIFEIYSVKNYKYLLSVISYYQKEDAYFQRDVKKLLNKLVEG